MCPNFIFDEGKRGWIKLCSSCDVDSTPSEKSIGKMTLLKCKRSCELNVQETETECTGIDYGKGTRDKECFLNYGGETTYNKTSAFDAYILKGYFFNIVLIGI